jgi:hypothetical protein
MEKKKRKRIPREHTAVLVCSVILFEQRETAARVVDARPVSLPEVDFTASEINAYYRWEKGWKVDVSLIRDAYQQKQQESQAVDERWERLKEFVRKNS